MLEAGGVYYNENFGSDVIVRNSSFHLNFGQYGGALSVYDSNMIVEDCNLTSNWVSRICWQCGTPVLLLNHDANLLLYHRP